MAKGIVVLLTKEQQEKIRPVIKRIEKMAENGKPGIAIAQVYSDHIGVGYLTHEQGKAVQEILSKLGSKTPVGKTRNSAFED